MLTYPYQCEFTEPEHAAGTATTASIEKMRHIFEETGILLMHNVLTREAVADLYSGWAAQYPHLAGPSAPHVSDPSSLPVGDRRALAAMDLSGPFASPDLYANPFILPLLRALLGPRCILANFTCVVSYPGAGPQHRHVDHPPLFDFEVGASLPCYALTVAIPLVDLNETTGTTALWPGSHRDDTGLDRDPVLPFVPMGSAYLMDYRTTHQGMPNRGDQPRPVLYLVYSRPWFRDDTNFWRFNPNMRMPDAVPAHVRHLFAAAVPEVSRPFCTMMPVMRSAMALLEENERDHASGRPLPTRSLEEADARLFELVRCTFGDADPRLGDAVEAMRRYIAQANRHMGDEGVAPDRRGEAIKAYLAQAMAADVTPSGPRHPGLYVAAVQRIKAAAAFREASYRSIAYRTLDRRLGMFGARPRVHSMS